MSHSEFDEPGVARMKLYDVMPLADYEWIEVEIEEVTEFHLDGWRIHLAGTDGVGSCTVVVNTNQMSAILFAKSGLLEYNIFPTSHQMIGTLSKMLGAEVSRVLIESLGDGVVSFGKVELEALDGRKFFLNTSAGEAIAISSSCGAPLFALRGMMREMG